MGQNRHSLALGTFLGASFAGQPGLSLPGRVDPLGAGLTLLGYWPGAAVGWWSDPGRWLGAFLHPVEDPCGLKDVLVAQRNPTGAGGGPARGKEAGGCQAPELVAVAAQRVLIKACCRESPGVFCPVCALC